MKLTFVTLLKTRTLVIPKDPAEANPLKGWNNAYHGTSEPGKIYPGVAHAIDEEARVSNLKSNRNVKR